MRSHRSTILLPSLQPQRPLSELETLVRDNFPKTADLLPQLVTRGLELLANCHFLTAVDKAITWQFYARRIGETSPSFTSDYYRKGENHFFAGASFNFMDPVSIIAINPVGHVFRGTQTGILLCCNLDYSQLTQVLPTREWVCH